MRILKALFILKLTVLLTITSLGIKAQETTPAVAEQEALVFAQRGPYAVGRTWLLANAETDSPIPVVVWYPALTPEANQVLDALTVPEGYLFANGARMESAGVWGSAILDASPDSSNAPYPLILFSTGYGASPNLYLYLQEHLASYGFIVAAALPLDSGIWKTYILRPLVIRQAIDFAEQLNTLEGSFQGLIDTAHVGVVGHSVGGYAALSSAGAQLDMNWFETWCAENTGMMMTRYDCPDVLGNQQQMMELANIDTLPTGLWPSWRDPRVSAIVSQSVPAQVLGAEGLAPVSIPTMIQFGSNDQEVGSDWAGYQTYESVSSPIKSQLVFEGGNHMMFAEGNGYAPEGWDIHHVHDLVNHFTTAFLLDILKSDEAAHQVLLPDAVSFPNISYTTTMN